MLQRAFKWSAKVVPGSALCSIVLKINLRKQRFMGTASYIDMDKCIAMLREAGSEGGYPAHVDRAIEFVDEDEGREESFSEARLLELNVAFGGELWQKHLLRYKDGVKVSEPIPMPKETA
jgi:hypothetical protein